MSYLHELREKSTYIIREAKAQCARPAILCSFGKDSVVMLHLVKKAFGTIPFPVIHLDTGYKFPEMYAYRDMLAELWKFELIIAKNQDAIVAGMNPEKGHVTCCNALKTENLKKVIGKNSYDAIFVGIRRDEHGIRSKEHYFSPRANDFSWRVSMPSDDTHSDSGLISLQDPEFSGWDIYATEYDDSSHIRVHPLLHWSEIDVWEHIREHDIPINPLYFAKDGKRYRSLGCMPCTKPIDSKADTVEKIIEELKRTRQTERDGRDNTKEDRMEALRSLGYM